MTGPKGPCSAHRGRVILDPVSPRSSGDRALASGARCGSSNLPGGTTSHYVLLQPGRGAAVARLVWDQEVGSSNLPAPTIAATDLHLWRTEGCEIWRPKTRRRSQVLCPLAQQPFCFELLLPGCYNMTIRNSDRYVSGALRPGRPYRHLLTHGRIKNASRGASHPGLQG